MKEISFMIIRNMARFFIFMVRLYVPDGNTETDNSEHG
jgi:hypothetical protein